MVVANDRYGPSGHLVKSFLDEITGEAFSLDHLGEPDPQDQTVRRMTDWQTVAEFMEYELEVPTMPNGGYFLTAPGASQTPFIDFLELLGRADAENLKHVEVMGLHAALQQAVDDAANRFHDAHPGEDSLLYIGAIPDDRVGEWELTLAGQCASIATEFVVAHATDIHMFRDLWYWYRRGHWPIGWDGEWPNGRLIVF